MTSTWLFIVSFIPPLILYGALVRAKLRGWKLGSLVIGATLVHEVMLIVFPTLYSVFTDYKLENEMLARVNEGELLRVMIGESIFVLLFVLAMFVRLPSIGVRSSQIVSARGAERMEQPIATTLIVIGCLVYLSMLAFPSGADEKSAGGGLGQLHFWLKSVFWYTPLVASAYFLTQKGGFRTAPFRTALASLPILSLVLIGVITGVRGRIVWAISLLVVMGIYHGRKKLIAVSLVLSLLMIPLFAILGGADIREAGSSGATQLEIIGKLYESGKESVADYGALTDLFLYSYAWRAQGVRNSATLYQDHDHGGGGFSSYLGSVFVPVPRLIWEKKPMIGSQDHTELQSAMYKVMDLAYGAPDQMGPMLASSHAYWEGGWIWLICAGVITGLMWNVIFRFTAHLPRSLAAVVIFTFAAAHMVDGLLTMMIPLYAAINAMWLSILPVFLIYKGFKSLRAHARFAARERAALP